jgi:hypothetical protein
MVSDEEMMEVIIGDRVLRVPKIEDERIGPNPGQWTLVPPKTHVIPPVPPFVPASDTSAAAARAIEPHLTKLQARVLSWIEANPGCSDEQIAEGTGLVLNTVRPRRVELAKMGRIIMERGSTIVRSGRKAHTWRVTTSTDQGF